MKKLKRAITSFGLPHDETKLIEAKCEQLIDNHFLDWVLSQLSFDDQKTWTVLAMKKKNDDEAAEFLAFHIPAFAKRSKEELERYEAELVAHILEVSHGSRR
ncbi:MAG: hypothetical protein Q8R11_01140 [bacterium]|nr:hypothetical protein [bacterium]